jgi:hypothetical protein
MERFITAHKGIYGSHRDGSVGEANVIICDQISFSHPITAINVDSLITQKSLSPCSDILNTRSASCDEPPVNACQSDRLLEQTKSQPDFLFQ